MVQADLLLGLLSFSCIGGHLPNFSSYEGFLDGLLAAKGALHVYL
jgi:hypothetical protein